MNKQSVTEHWDHLRQTFGMGIRAVEAIPPDKIDNRPIPNMRTPKELVTHAFSLMSGIAEGAARGEILDDAGSDQHPEVKTHADLVKFCHDAWKRADRAVASLTDAQITAMVKTPWGMSFPGFVCVGIIHDEFVHHRGQLYAYLRQLGKEPPMMWDFEHNAPEFQPRPQVQAQA